MCLCQRPREAKGYTWLQNKHQACTWLLTLPEQIGNMAGWGRRQCVLGKHQGNWRMFWACSPTPRSGCDSAAGRRERTQGSLALLVTFSPARGNRKLKTLLYPGSPHKCVNRLLGQKLQERQLRKAWREELTTGVGAGSQDDFCL